MNDDAHSAAQCGYDLDDGREPLETAPCTLGLEACGLCQQQCQRTVEPPLDKDHPCS